jgi:hypothetical protein
MRIRTSFFPMRDANTLLNASPIVTVRRRDAWTSGVASTCGERGKCDGRKGRRRKTGERLAKIAVDGQGRCGRLRRTGVLSEERWRMSLRWLDGACTKIWNLIPVAVTAATAPLHCADRWLDGACTTIWNLTPVAVTAATAPLHCADRARAVQQRCRRCTALALSMVRTNEVRRS